MPDSLIASSPLPYWRLSSFYFFYFCVVGAMVPYWGIYLKVLGYSSQDVGIISAIILATRILAPNFWGWLADHTQQRLRVIRFGSFIACLFFSGIFLSQKFAWLVLVVSTYTFFWHAILPQFEAITLTHLGKNYQGYGKIRLWGSVGFIAAVVGLGWALDFLSIAYLPAVIMTFLLLIWLSSLSLQRVISVKHSDVDAGFWRIAMQPTILCFLIVSFLLQFSHGPYYAFYSLYLIDNYAYSSSATGLLWALGVLAEIFIFIVIHRLLYRFSLRSLLLWSLLLTSLRWSLIALLADKLLILLFAQLLHACSFGVLHAVSIEIVRSYFGGRHQSQGQALYSSLSFGAGGAAGALMAGLLWDYSASVTFLLSAAATVLALMVTWWGIFPQTHTELSTKSADMV